MAYKYTRGAVNRGDIYNEDDTQGNTYLDWNEDALGVVAGGTTVFVVSGSTALVGIGTNAPDYTLDVAGNIGVDGNIYHNDNAETLINFSNDKIVLKAGNKAMVTMEEKGSAPHEVTINDGGNNIDFVVKGNSNNPGMKFDASNNRLGINGVGSPSWALDVAGDIGLAEYIYHKGDDDTYIRFEDDEINIKAGNVNFINITEATQDKITFNDGGADVDFIVQSPSGSKAIYLNAGNEVLHINHDESGFKTKIHNTHGEAITVNDYGVIFNEDGAAANDFRIESATNTHMLFVDAGSSEVGIGTSSPTSTFEVSGSQGGNYTQTAASITFNETHYVVDYTGNGNATFTLPATSGVTGRQYHILSHAQGGGDKLTITGSGGAFQGTYLEGDATSVDIDGNTPQSITVLSTGTNWFILHDGRSEE